MIIISSQQKQGSYTCTAEAKAHLSILWHSGRRHGIKPLILHHSACPLCRPPPTQPRIDGDLPCGICECEEGCDCTETSPGREGENQLIMEGEDDVIDLHSRANDSSVHLTRERQKRAVLHENKALRHAPSHAEAG